MLAGESGAAYELDTMVNKIPGVTSFTQMYMLSLPLYAAYRYIFGMRPPKILTLMVLVLGVAIFVRAILGTERFAIIEAAVCVALPILTFSPRRLPLVGWFPALGFGALLVLFAAGEFTRSWAAYSSEFNSFWEYIYVRLLGYLATATNNGAGLYEVFGASGYPYFTAAWFSRLPIWDALGVTMSDGKLVDFMEQYGSAEFNNPSGLMAGVVDYGLTLGLVYYGTAGILCGVSYRLFRKASPLGLLSYPSLYVGLLLMTQAIYWGDPRYFTVAFATLIVWKYISVRVVSASSPAATPAINRDG
jgi:oligosaccharide repeat unit polymerase